ncbi:HlyD family type I secretion periplasmic adaptor subunit [Comamonas antarctica]|uniref:HlyD family type I secretion periplasmic adaptor subunit n=1 Tax=Comamonas antarctica TaxID=2743470 RepID=UPI0028E33D61|nr:HlyD family type I secretion periplasmic adaptor subunit [Comamonas antarctica]
MSPSPAPLAAAPAAAADTDTDTDAPELDGARLARRAGRIGLWILAVGFGGFLLWAAFAPLDEGVPGTGVVAIDTKRKTVQHLHGGIVSKVLVREGDTVRKGQLLMQLDPTSTEASHAASRLRYLGLRAEQARLTAEYAGAQSLHFHDDLLAAQSEPVIRQQMQVQQQLFLTRSRLLRADLQSIEENILGLQGMQQAYASMLQSRTQQLSLLNEELHNLRGLVSEGYVPRNRQLELERQVADANTAIADLQGNAVRTLRGIAEQRQRLLSRQQEQRKEVESRLTEVEREVSAEQEKFKALADELARLDIRSPADGQVVGLMAQTVGGVIQPGQTLMDIVPVNAPLLLEARVPPHLIDRVRAGMPVDVRFSSFAHSPQLAVEGQVHSVSADLLTDEKTGTTYYLARIGVTPRGMQRLGPRQLQPGMPVEVVFKTGERSLLTYLLHPLTKRIAASMTEE